MDSVVRDGAVEELFRVKENKGFADLSQDAEPLEQGHRFVHDVQPVMERAMVNRLVNQLDISSILRRAHAHQQDQS